MTKGNSIGFWLVVAAVSAASVFQVCTNVSMQRHAEARDRLSTQGLLVNRILRDAEKPLDREELKARYAELAAPFTSHPYCPSLITDEELDLAMFPLLDAGLLVTDEEGVTSYLFGPPSYNSGPPRGGSPLSTSGNSPPDDTPTP